MSNLSENIQKYFFSGLLTVTGALFLVKGISSIPLTANNPDVSWTLFLIGGVGMLLGGIISALFIAGLITKKISLVIGVLFLAASIYFVKSNYDSIVDRIALQDKYNYVRDHVKQGLIDIRDVQVEYKKIKGKFAPNFDSLVLFIHNEKTYDIKKTGQVPDGKISEEYWAKLGYKKTDADFFSKIEGWDEDEALKAGVIKMDTIWKPLVTKLFDVENKTQRNRTFDFNPDSIEFVRGYKNGTLRFIMAADTLGDGSPVFLAKEPEPFYILGEEKDTLQIGSLKDTKTTGNWGER
ncbi:MAG: sulfite exporter TauE/SafE family protein [Bacteroidia bacterium]